MSFFKSKQNLFMLFCTVVISLLMIITTVYFTRFNCFLDDDEHYALINGLKYSDIFKSLMFTEHGGGYIGYFICKFMCFFIPLKLGIHPADYLCSPVYNTIKGLLIVLICLFTAKFSAVYCKSKTLFTLAFMFLCTWVVYVFLNTASSIFFYNYNFYRYFFSLIFFIYLIYFLFKNINNDEKPGYYEIIAASFCAYVVGTSSEMLFISAIILYLLLGLIKLISKNYKINKRLFIPFIFLIIAVILFSSSQGFVGVAKDRGLLETNFTIDYLFDFIKYYFIIYFKNFWGYWFVCAITVFITFIFYKNTLKTLLFPSLFQLSVLIAYFSLILCANESPYQSNGCTYFIGHANLIFLFFMIMTIPLFIYVSNLLSRMKNDRIPLFVITAVILALIYLNIVNPMAKAFPYNLHLPRENNYKIDKIVRMQLLLGKKPVIPYSLIENRSTMWYTPQYWIEYCRYFAWVYGDNRLMDSELVIDETDKTLNEFYKEGGVFTEKELKDIKFSRLKSDEFVLENSN